MSQKNSQYFPDDSSIFRSSGGDGGVIWSLMSAVNLQFCGLFVLSENGAFRSLGLLSHPVRAPVWPRGFVALYCHPWVCTNDAISAVGGHFHRLSWLEMSFIEHRLWAKWIFLWMFMIPWGPCWRVYVGGTEMLQHIRHFFYLQRCFHNIRFSPHMAKIFLDKDIFPLSTHHL